MKAAGKLVAQNPIDLALARNTAHPFETPGDHEHAEMRLAFGTGASMAGVQGGFVDHFQLFGLQRFDQFPPDRLGNTHVNFPDSSQKPHIAPAPRFDQASLPCKILASRSH